MRAVVLLGVSSCGMKADDSETDRPRNHLGPWGDGLPPGGFG